MAGLTALNRTIQLLLTNNSGSDLALGDVVVMDNTLASSVKTTTLVQNRHETAGVCLESIPAGSAGMVAVAGYVRRINLLSSASLGYKFHTSSTAKRATTSGGSAVLGSFGEVLSSGSTPEALLWGKQIQAVT